MGRRQCQHAGCCKQAQASLEGVSKYCFTHMTFYGMSPKTHICEHEGCFKQVATSSCGMRKYCRGHMKEYGLQPREHQCQHEGCEKRVQTSEEGSRLYCIQHMRHYGLNPRQHTCKHAGCQSRACYSTDGQRLFCGTHMRQNGLKPQRRLCIQDGCVKQAQCSKTGEYNYCYAHMKLYGLKPYRGKGQIQRPVKKQRISPPPTVNATASTTSDSSETTNMAHRTSPVTSNHIRSPVVSSIMPLDRRSTAAPSTAGHRVNPAVSLRSISDMYSPEEESRAHALHYSVAATGRYDATQSMLPPMNEYTQDHYTTAEYCRDSFSMPDYSPDPVPGKIDPAMDYTYDYEHAFHEEFDRSFDILAGPCAVKQEDGAVAHIHVQACYPQDVTASDRKLMMLPPGSGAPSSHPNPSSATLSNRNTSVACKLEPLGLDVSGSVPAPQEPSSQFKADLASTHTSFDDMLGTEWLDAWPDMGNTAPSGGSSHASAIHPPSAVALQPKTETASRPTESSHGSGVLKKHTNSPELPAHSSASVVQANTPGAGTPPSSDMVCTPLKSAANIFDGLASTGAASKNVTQVHSIFGSPGPLPSTPISSSSPLANTDWLLESPLLSDHFLDSALLTFTPLTKRTPFKPQTSNTPPVARQLNTGDAAALPNSTGPADKTSVSALPLLGKTPNPDMDLSMPMLGDPLCTPSGKLQDALDAFDLGLPSCKKTATHVHGTQSGQPAPGTCRLTPLPSSNAGSLAQKVEIKSEFDFDWQPVQHHQSGRQHEQQSNHPGEVERITNCLRSLSDEHWQQIEEIGYKTGLDNLSGQSGHGITELIDEWGGMSRQLPSGRSASVPANMSRNLGCHNSLPVKVENHHEAMPVRPTPGPFRQTASHESSLGPFSSRVSTANMPRQMSTKASPAEWMQKARVRYERQPSATDLFSMSSGRENTPPARGQYTNTREFSRGLQAAAAAPKVTKPSRPSYQMSPAMVPPNEGYGCLQGSYSQVARPGKRPAADMLGSKYDNQNRPKGQYITPMAAAEKWRIAGGVAGRSSSTKSLEEQSAALRDSCALREAALNAAGPLRKPSMTGWPAYM